MDFSILEIFFMLALFLLYLGSLFMVYRSSQSLRHFTLDSSFLIHVVITSIPFFILLYMDISLPLFYIMIYFASNFTIHYLYSKKHGKWLLGNLHYITFMSTHLIVLGIITGLTEYDIKGVLAQDDLRIGSVCIVLMINIILLSLMRKIFRKSFLVLEDLEGEEVQLFSKFIWFCAFFVMLDSIPCLFHMPVKLSSLYMIGTNCLLQLMILLFGRHTYNLLKNEHIKKQYFLLKEEESKQLHQLRQWEQRAYQDRLTQAYTRTYIMHNLATMLKEKESFALVFIDLDGLKKVNDEYGHLVGDELLQAFATCMKKALRPKDIFARYGGDEFLILMPECDKENAKVHMQACQQQMKQACFSYGIVCVSGAEEMQLEELIALADQEMYKAKLERKKAGDTL